MNKRTLLTLVVLLAGLTQLYAKSAPTGVEKIINSIDPKLNIGIEVIDLHTNAVLYQRNARQAFIPASNMKLFSDAAALMVLGPDYRFNNTISINGQRIQNQEFYGDVILHLSGDPSFGQSELSSLFQSLSKWNIRRIHGDIIIDSALNHVAPYAAGRMKEDLDYAYGAPIAPLMLQQNRILITVNPAGKIGKPAIIEHNAPYKNLSIVNKVKTRKDGKSCGVAFKMNNNNVLTVSGCILRGQWAIIQNLALTNPFLHAQQSIHAVLQQQNIQLTGKVRMGKAPKNTLLLEQIDSPPIAQLIIDTMKSSDNLYADALFLHAAAKLQNKMVDWKEAHHSLKHFIHQATGIDMQQAN